MALTTRRNALAVTALALTLGLATTADAQRRGGANKIDTVRFDVHGDFAWYSLGAGFRVEFAIVPDGFLQGDIEDELALSPGFDMFFVPYATVHNYSDVVFAPLIVAQWNLYLNDKWSVFPELGMVTLFGNYGRFAHRHRYWDQGHSHVYFDVAANVGARYHFSDRVALLMRVGYPAGFQIGITF